MSFSDFDVLRKLAVFGGMNAQALSLLSESGTLIERDEGEHFFRQGENGDSLFVLREGEVIVERDWQGLAVTLGRLGPGDCFGEMSLIDLMPRSASVRACKDSNALQIPQRCLHLLYKQSLEQYAILMMNMGREVSRRLRAADDRLFALEQQLPTVSS